MIRRPRMDDFSPGQLCFVRACAYFGTAAGAAATTIVPWWTVFVAGLVGVVWECWRSAEETA